MNDAVPVFELVNLTFSYPDQTLPAIEDITLCIPRGAFLVLCGPSGCGKSTLLRQLKSVLTPHGVRTGQVLFNGTPLDAADNRMQASAIGFVTQNPENQTVTDKVWHELAFGLESLGCDTQTIRRRVAETASFFGIQTWFTRPTAELSGGQKQLLNLASVMVMQPEVLVLDEPTSQLDPIAASDFLAALARINRELGTTVILSEHRLEEALALADTAAVLSGGRLICTGTPAEVGQMLKAAGHSMFQSMPVPMRVWAAAETDAACPVTVKDGCRWLAGFAASHPLNQLPASEPVCGGDVVLSAEDVHFRYDPEQEEVVRGLNLTLRRGECLALLGGNGTGKTTSLKLLAGLKKPQRGAILSQGVVRYLPQNPQTLFLKKTVREDLFDGREPNAEAIRLVRLCQLESLLDRHPYDLSGGEQQRAALAKLLMAQPDILLLDEPTKGMDAAFKEQFAAILKSLLARGAAVLMASHDVEFCAAHAHRCALLFHGEIVSEATPRSFFSGGSFYTTTANRMVRGAAAEVPSLPEAVTAAELIRVCGGIMEPRASEPDCSLTEPLPPPCAGSPDDPKQKLPRWRKWLAAVDLTGLFGLLFWMSAHTELARPGELVSKSRMVQYGLLFALLAIFAAAVSRRSAPPAVRPQKRRLSKRTVAAAVSILLLIPLTLWGGMTLFAGRRYYLTAILVLLECMAPFFLVFEGRKPQARELVVIAVLCAIGVAGRAVFFMLPQFKPVMAIAILAGVAFGGETGFLVGAVTMLASNVLFAQGPWTPWQMFAMGLVGFTAGVLFQRGRLLARRAQLSIFGALSALILYGGLMNFASAVMWSTDLTWEILLSYYLSGFPMECIHAAATAFFLWIAAEPMLEKLERIRKKYGLIDSASNAPQKESRHQR